MMTPQLKLAPVRLQQLHQGEGTKQWKLYLLATFQRNIPSGSRWDRSWQRAWFIPTLTFFRAIALYAAFNRTNNFRWGSVYLEDMVKLPTAAPKVYICHQKGSFSVKVRSSRYIVVAVDQKLEQYIHLLSKNSDFFIGNAKQKGYIAQWDLIYHKMEDIHCLDKEYAVYTDGGGETLVHQQISKKVICQDESSIGKMLVYLKSMVIPWALMPPLYFK